MAIQTEQAIRFTDRHKREYHIFPNEILYVEADNIYCLLICKDQNISVPYPIILMQELLPAYFYQNPSQLFGQPEFYCRSVSPHDYVKQWFPPPRSCKEISMAEKISGCTKFQHSHCGL